MTFEIARSFPDLVIFATQTELEGGSSGTFYVKDQTGWEGGEKREYRTRFEYSRLIYNGPSPGLT